METGDLPGPAAAPPPIASSGPRPGRALLVDAEQLAEVPARDRRAGPGQLRPELDRQRDPRDGPVGLGKIGGGDRGPRSQTIAAAEGSARSTRTRSMRSGAFWGSRIFRPARRAIVETPPAPELV
jgi:hypothetical protein